jgi:hypothetical protein
MGTEMASFAAGDGRRLFPDKLPESTFVADDPATPFTVTYASGLEVHVTPGSAWVRLPRQRAGRQNIGVARRASGRMRPEHLALPGDGVLGLSMARPFYGPGARFIDAQKPRVPFAERVVVAFGSGASGSEWTLGRLRQAAAAALCGVAAVGAREHERAELRPRQA